MALPIETFTLGVEEEYQIVDATTRSLVQRQARLLPGAQRILGDEVQPELQLSQIEIATPVCRTLADVRRALARARHEVDEAAKASGSRIAASGTHPFSAWSEQSVTPKARYLQIADDFEQIARETVIFGCHVHVAIPERSIALGVMNRVRARLSPLLALAANSPYWLGAETGYASYRTGIWSRWPLSGPPQHFASNVEYDALVRRLIDVEMIEDETKLYWDVRPSGRFPTLEFRVTDVCLTIDEAVMIAGLARALARSAYLAELAGKPYEPVRQELLRVAHWRAARYGLDGRLVDLDGSSTVAAPEAIEAFVGSVREALEEAGDYAEISTVVHETLARGNGASRQRAAYARRGHFEDVVDYIVAETHTY